MTIDTIADVNKELVEQYQIIKNLEKIKNTMLRDVNSQSDAGQLAIFLHKNLCKWNHTDGCGWYYEINNDIHDWSGSAHIRYWNITNKLITSGFKCDDVTKMINIVTGHN